MSRRRGIGRLLVALGVAVSILVPAAPQTIGTGPTIEQLIGQKLIVAMSGTTPSAALLGRIRRGEVGGVILFGANIVDSAQVAALTTKLHAAAVAGGQPRFLIAVDQEGGSIKRIPWVPPTLSPPQMGALSSTVAHRQGAATGEALAGLGIDLDLAPVVDVPASTASILYRQGRTWSFDAARTALLGTAFASGLKAGGVLPALKHFPGLGYATANTDARVVTIRQSVAALRPGLRPYTRGILLGLPIVMLSNATYPAWDPHYAAGWSVAINTTLLRTQLGFKGVTMTDSLDGTAAARGYPTSYLALRAAQAGTDMLLVTGSETTSARVFSSLVAQARAGHISLARLRASYNRILALKTGP